MKSSPFVVSLLVLAYLVADMAVVSELVMRLDEWPGYGGAIGMGLALGQVCLLVVWVVWGRASVVLKVALGGLGMVALALLAAVSTEGRRRPDMGEWLGAMLIFVGLLAVPMALVRLGGYRLAAEEQRSGGERGNTHTRWQFTIWGLLSAMTAVGLLLGLLRSVEWPLQHLMSVLFFFTIFMVSSCFAFFTPFLIRWWLVVIPFLAGLFLLAGLLLPVTGISTPEPWTAFLAASFAHGTAILVGSAVLKSAGFRLARGQPVGAKGSECSTSEQRRPSDRPDEP